MEDTLRVGQLIKGAELGGLNPCFNGRYSQRMFSGRGQHTIRWVLILVLMEDTLRDLTLAGRSLKKGVLILVLMEDTLRVFDNNSSHIFVFCLNPCFNGRYSQRH